MFLKFDENFSSNEFVGAAEDKLKEFDLFACAHDIIFKRSCVVMDKHNNARIQGFRFNGTNPRFILELLQIQEKRSYLLINIYNCYRHLAELRAEFKCPITITRGYYPLSMNRKVKGSSDKSHHIIGAAVDIIFAAKDRNKYEKLKKYLETDYKDNIAQMVTYYSGKEILFFHLAFKSNFIPVVNMNKRFLEVQYEN